MKLLNLCLLVACVSFAQVQHESTVQRARDDFGRRRTHHNPSQLIHQPLGDEFLIDASTGFSRAPSDQQYANAAFDGTNYLVVWTDSRGNNEDIYGARVTKDGIVLDSSGIAICTAPDYQQHPKVAFDGTNYLVVWTDLRNGYPDWNIYGARVSAAGVLLDSAGIVISNAANVQESPSVAFDGTNYFVVWHDLRDGITYHVYGARVSQSGAVIDTAGIQLTVYPNGQGLPSVAFDGTNFLVAWTDFRYGSDIYGARVSRTGVVIDTANVPICTKWPTEETNPAVAFNGSNFLVVWEEQWPNYDILGARVSPSGAVLDTNGIVVSNAGGYQGSPSITSDGNNFMVVWRDFRAGNTDTYGARVSPAGVLLDTNGIPLRANPAMDEDMPSIAYGDTSYFLVWNHKTPPDYLSSDDIYGARMSRSGSMLDTSDVCISTLKVTVESWEPRTAFDDTNYLVVWESYRGNDPSDIRGARLSASGAVLDATGFDICIDGGYQYYPAVAFGDSTYLVVWEDAGGSNDDIDGAVVSRDGSVLDQIRICRANDNQWQPRVAFDDTNFFVVWRDFRGYGSNIYGARVTQDGSVLDYDGFPVFEQSGSDDDPDVAFDGTNYLVVWEHSGDIYGCRVSRGGEVLDPDGFIISDEANDEEDPAVTFDGTNYLAVWSDKRNADIKDVYAARISPTGVVLDTAGLAICTATGEQEYPSVVFDGTNYIVAWDDYRNDSTASDIYGARVSTSGVVLEEVPIVNQPWESSSPMLARGSGSDVLLAYSCWTGVYDGVPYNAWRVWGKFDPLVVGVEEIASAVPVRFELGQNYPNPFNPVTSFEFRLPALRVVDRQAGVSSFGFVSLKVYDVLGREVAVLVNEVKQPGEYTVRWDASGMPSGVYFYRLQARPFDGGQAGNYVNTKKLVLMK